MENAANLPIIQAHGEIDAYVPNSVEGYTCTADGVCDTDRPLCGTKPCEDYENARDFVANVGSDQWCAGNEAWCGGNWLYAFQGSLTDLNASFPGFYSSSSVWTPGSHCWNAVPSVNGPEDVLWIEYVFSRFEGLRRPANPQQVVYKSYTDLHTKAYWASIEIADPWTDRPGLIAAARGDNRVDLSLYRVQVAALDLASMGFDLSAPGSMTLTVAGYALNGQKDPRSGIAVRLEGFPQVPISVIRNGNPAAFVYDTTAQALALTDVSTPYDTAGDEYVVSF